MKPVAVCSEPRTLACLRKDEKHSAPNINSLSEDALGWQGPWVAIRPAQKVVIHIEKAPT